MDESQEVEGGGADSDDEEDDEDFEVGDESDEDVSTLSAYPCSHVKDSLTLYSPVSCTGRLHRGGRGGPKQHRVVRHRQSPSTRAKGD
jgi:hypothetical protein